MEKKKFNYKFMFYNIIIAIILSSITTLIFLISYSNPTPMQVNNLITFFGHDEFYDYQVRYTLDLIEDIALNNSQSHEYIKGEYDCKQFSNQLVIDLYYQKLKAYCVWGFVKDENSFLGYGKHQWVEIIIDNQVYPIEATTGYLIDNETYSDNYKIINKGWCL